MYIDKLISILGPEMFKQCEDQHSKMGYQLIQHPLDTYTGSVLVHGPNFAMAPRISLWGVHYCHRTCIIEDVVPDQIGDQASAYILLNFYGFFGQK